MELTNKKSLLEALRHCKAKGRWTDFSSQYDRHWLHPKHDFMEFTLFSGDGSEIVRGSFRGARLYKEWKSKGGVTNRSSMDKAHEYEQNGDFLEANRVFYEAYFWFGKKPELNERGIEAKNGYERTVGLVTDHENMTLENLQDLRDNMCENLHNIDWCVALQSAYCEGLIRSAIIVSGKEITLDQIRALLEKGDLPIGMEKTSHPEDVRNLAKGYAFVIDTVDKEQEIDIEFLKRIHSVIYIDKPEDTRGKEAIGGKIVHEKDRLTILLAWLNFKKRNRKADSITLAALAHYGIVMLQPFMDGNHRTGRLLQDFILMDSGYPPLSIQGEDVIKEYQEVSEEPRLKWGADIRPFIRFVYNRMKATIALLQAGPPKKDIPESVSNADLVEIAREAVSESGSSCDRIEVARGTDSFNKLSFSSSGGSNAPPILPDSPLSILSAKFDEPKETAEGAEMADSQETVSGDPEAQESNLAFRKEAVNPGWSYLMKTALEQMNPALLDYPRDVPPKVSKLAYHREAVNPGWSHLMKTALGQLNPELLKY